MTYQVHSLIKGYWALWVAGLSTSSTADGMLIWIGSHDKNEKRSSFPAGNMPQTVLALWTGFSMLSTC